MQATNNPFSLGGKYNIYNVLCVSFCFCAPYTLYFFCLACQSAKMYAMLHFQHFVFCTFYDAVKICLCDYASFCYYICKCKCNINILSLSLCVCVYVIVTNVVAIMASPNVLVQPLELKKHPNTRQQQPPTSKS